MILALIIIIIIRVGRVFHSYPNVLHYKNNQVIIIIIVIIIIKASWGYGAGSHFHYRADDLFGLL